MSNATETLYTIADIEAIALAWFRSRHQDQACRDAAREWLDNAQANKRALLKLGIRF